MKPKLTMMTIGTPRPSTPPAVHASELPPGWQRIGDSYRRVDGFLLRELGSELGRNPGYDGVVTLYTLAPSDWLLIGESLDALALKANAYHDVRRGLVGIGPYPNDFAFWMAAVDKAIPRIGA